MSEHPYPDHVVEAVAEAMGRSRTGEDWGRFKDYFIEHTHVALQALWDASRVETIEQRDELPMTAVVEDAFGAICVKYRHDAPPFGWLRITPAVEGGKHHHPPYLPAHVIYWGDADE